MHFVRAVMCAKLLNQRRESENVRIRCARIVRGDNNSALLGSLADGSHRQSVALVECLQDRRNVAGT